MTTFWIAVALLSATAVGILLVPLWRWHRRAGQASVVPWVVGVAVAPVAIAVYLQVSDWDHELAERAAQGSRLVDQLAERLQRTPDDVDGWRLLAASYVALGRYAEGRAAYQQVWTRTPNPDDDLKLAFAEAQILADQRSIGGEAGRLVEEVLASRPREGKALWFGGFVAIERGRLDLARERWSALLALNPPDEIATILRSQLASLEAAGAGRPPAAAEGAAPVEPSGPTIRVAVSLSAGRAVEELGPSAQLYIIARAPEGGPPLAVLRQPASAVPGEFALSDANTMIQGRSLANYEELTLVARLSRSGQPIEQPGDWTAETVVRPADGGVVALVIDQVVQ